MTTEGLTFKDAVAREGVIRAAQRLRVLLTQRKHRVHHDDWAMIETYLAVSMRLLDNLPFDQIKDAAVTEEIKARLDGREVR